MTALPTIYITRYDRLIHSDLGGRLSENFETATL